MNPMLRHDDDLFTLWEQEIIIAQCLNNNNNRSNKHVIGRISRRNTL